MMGGNGNAAGTRILHNFFLFLIFYSLSCSLVSSYSLSSTNLSSSWCSYLQEYPEPSFLFYNRLGKAGSTTIQEYLHTLSKNNHFISYDSPAKYWLDFEDNPVIRRSFEHQILDKYSSHPNQSVVANGHWSQYSFDSSNFLLKHIEYFQLIRNCSTIATSHFLYSLFDSRAARSANHSNHLRIREILHLDLNNQSNITIDECLESEECITNSHYFDQFDHLLLTALCGKQCQKFHSSSPSSSTPTNTHEHQDQVQSNRNRSSIQLGSLFNLHTPSIFTVIGVLEHLPAFLSLLECVYPTLLSGITRLNQRQHMTARVSHVNITVKNISGVSKVVEKMCLSPHNQYREIYEEVEKLMLKKYEHMKANPNKCCRKRHSLSR